MDILKSIKRKVKKSRILFAIYLLQRAIRQIKIDFTPIREFRISLKGGQNLSSENYRFYSNIKKILYYENNDKKLHFIDVGANDGWFARIILRFFHNARITSFEPLKSQHIFLENLSKENSNFKFHPVALGQIDESRIITEYKTTGLSTLKSIDSKYNYNDKHFSQEILDTYPVPVFRLDNFLSKSLKNDEINILKIDTQGFELEVLKGSTALFSQHKIKYIIIELMTISKYSEASLYDEVLDFLHIHGFKLQDFHQSYYEENTGLLSEFDAIFKKVS